MHVDLVAMVVPIVVTKEMNTVKRNDRMERENRVMLIRPSWGH